MDHALTVICRSSKVTDTSIIVNFQDTGIGSSRANLRVAGAPGFIYVKYPGLNPLFHKDL